MKKHPSDRLAYSALAGAFLLAACGSLQRTEDNVPAPIGAAAFSDGQAASSYRVLHSFSSSGCDGFSPQAALIAVGATLYGTTREGGQSNVGTLYSITSGGTEQVIDSFFKRSRYGGRDGYLPVAPLIHVNDAFYGTTQYGGVPGMQGYGTVFRFKLSHETPVRSAKETLRSHCDQTGTNHLIYAFASGADGANSVAGLLNVNGAFFGTTAFGGSSNEGTVFSISPSGAEHVLHSFGGSDGSSPEAGLIDVNGTLFGTTYGGGAYNGGTVFSMNASGSEQVLHSFGSGSDGSKPLASLIEAAGMLYGTTSVGGTNGKGTIFSISPSGSELVRHSFGSGSDGAYPAAALIEMKGTLYGTTQGGGFYACSSITHCGTVFSVTTAGKEIVLHSFRGTPYDGQYPVGGLLALQGTLYGTTSVGGAAPSEGTVFALKP